MRLAWVSCAVVLVSATAMAAPAEPFDYESAAPPVTSAKPTSVSAPSGWYGWQTLLVDAALIGAFATYPAWSNFAGANALVTVDAIAFVAVAPIIHALHDNRSGAGVSIVLHLFVPMATTLLGLAAMATCALRCSSVWPGPYVGALAGGTMGTLVDSIGFAWDKRPGAKVSVAPYGVRGGAGLGVVCAF